MQEPEVSLSGSLPGSLLQGAVLSVCALVQLHKRVAYDEQCRAEWEMRQLSHRSWQIL